MIATFIKAGGWMMDAFGLGAFIDKIEEYLGRRVAAALVFTATVAAFVLFIFAIVHYGILPVADFVKGIGSQSFLEVLRKVGIGALITAACAVTWGTAINLWVRKKAKQILNKVDAAVTGLEAFYARAYEMVERADRATEEREKAKINDPKS